MTSKEPFNEKFRAEWEKDWEYVKVVVENYEVIGEKIECWTKKFPGDPAHFWQVPANKPVYMPRLLAKQLSNCKYHRLRMEETATAANTVGSDQMGTYVGSMIVDHTKHRFDVKAVSDNQFSFAGV